MRERSQPGKARISLPIGLGAVWFLLALILLYVANDILTTALFIPAFFPLSVFLVAYLDWTKHSLYVWDIMLLAYNLITGYAAGYFIGKYHSHRMFRKTCLTGLVLLVLYFFIFAGPLILTLLRGKPPSLVDHVPAFLARWEQSGVPSQLNSATYYRRAIDVIGKAKLEKLVDGQEFPPSRPWRADEFPRLASWLKDNQEVLENIRLGARKDFLSGVVKKVYPDNEDSPSLENFRPEIIQIMIAQLGLCMVENGLNKSIPDLVATIRLMKHYVYGGRNLVRTIMVLQTEPALHDLVRSALLSGSASERFCETLIRELQELDLLAERSLRNLLLLESRFEELSIFDAYNHPALYFRFFPEYERIPPVASKALRESIRRLKWRWWTLRWSLPATLALHKEYRMLLEKYLFAPAWSAEQGCTWEQLYTCRRNYAGPWSLFRGCYLIGLSTKEHSSNANRRLTILLAALKLYRLKEGTYPAKLEDLVPHYIESMPQDPFSNEGWVYTRQGGKLTLSSHEAQQEEDKRLSITFVED